MLNLDNSYLVLTKTTAESEFQPGYCMRYLTSLTFSSTTLLHQLLSSSERISETKLLKKIRKNSANNTLYNKK